MPSTAPSQTPPAAGKAAAADVAAPHVRVLLTTCNGGRWLEEQLASIQAQRGVKVSVVASDDASTDATLHILEEWAGRMDLQRVPSIAKRFGNANRNFLRLMREAPLGDATYIALADQDDVWLPDKLSVAVQRLQCGDIDAYSSDVIALWSDGRRTALVKSGRQRAFDYLFESAGPGCTFVLPRRIVEPLREWLHGEVQILDEVKVHDWLIYAYARTRSLRWFIDSRPGLLYRQHELNEIGANRGWRAAAQRWRQIRDGRYRKDVLSIARAVGDQSAVTRRLERLDLADRLALAATAWQCRRRRAEALMLALSFLLMPGAKR